MKNYLAKLLEQIGIDEEVGPIGKPAWDSLKAKLVEQFEIYESEKRAELEIQSKLKQARDDAVEASRLKSDFVATMSHEIRTPLNGILSLSQLLSASNLDPDQAEDVRGICSSASHLQTIVSNILDFSKIEAGKLSLDYQKYSLLFLLKDVERLMSGMVSEKNLCFHVDIAKDVPRIIFGDSAKLRQILINLLGNAMKFTFERGAVMLLVRASKVDARTEVEFSVVDTGIGISEEKTQLIFDSFYQADSSITRNHGGTGLGLAISKKLVDIMGGQISVKSREGIGSVFKVTIPVECSKAEFDSYNRLEAVKYIGNIAVYDKSSKQKRILVVDDNLINRITTARYLEKKGFHTIIASSGAEAIEKLDEEAFELVLLDLHMPGMSGYEVSRLVRNSGRPYQAIPIVAISADVQNHVVEECQNVGINRFFPKPLNFDGLIQTMEELVASK